MSFEQPASASGVTLGDDDSGKAKLPKQVQEKLPEEIGAEIESQAKEDLSVKVFKHARHFTSKDEQTFVEFFWDNDGKGMLKAVKGPTLSGLWRRRPRRPKQPLPEPKVQVSEHDNVLSEIKAQVTQLEKEGFEEMPEFLQAHKLHLPCFTWIVSEGPPGDDEPIMSSRIGGTPALYKGEEWPGDRAGEEWDLKFAFQINCATVPRRMQEIVGKSGLLQFFHSNEDEWFEEDYQVLRIIPEDEFGQLVPFKDDGDPPSYGYAAPNLSILGWTERDDYPARPCDFPSELKDQEHVQDTISSLGIGVDKFGGYLWYNQTTGDDYPMETACSECGQPHLGRFAVFNMKCQGMLRFPLADGNVQIFYCPSKPDNIHYIGGR